MPSTKELLLHMAQPIRTYLLAKLKNWQILLIFDIYFTLIGLLTDELARPFPLQRL